MILALILLLVLPGISASNIFVTNSVPAISYPIRFAYIDKILDWSSPQGIAKSIGLPGYAPAHKYNYVCFSFWTYSYGPLDVALVWNQSSTYFGSLFGSSDASIRNNIKKIYNDNGIKVMVSAFGATENPTSAGANATQCAQKLADFVNSNNLDGVDIDWEDTAAFQSGVGEQWLITFTTVLRNSLPSAIITHAPQAPYFGGTSLYPKNAYLAIQQSIGPMIQFYNVQFYNQGTTSYNNAAGLFNNSGGWAPGTSVNEIIARGVASNKIVVGKPATVADASSGSYMTASSISSAILANYQFNGWQAGVMFWQYSSDPNGTIISDAITPLLSLLNSTSPVNTTTNTTTNSTNSNSTNSTNSTGTNSTNATKTNTTNTNSTNTNSTNSTNTNNTNTNTTKTNSTNTTNTTNTNSTNTTNSSSKTTLTYPIRWTYISKITEWSTIKGLAKSLGIPGYAPTHIYNYVCLGFWTYSYGPVESAYLWHNPIGYFGTGSPFGSTNTQIRTNIKQIFASKGIKLMLGVFGKMQLPSTFNFNPVTCAQMVANYATTYNFDGVDINWSDLNSFVVGKGENWLANFTLTLQSLAPSLIITHSPMATYFSSSFTKGGYVQVHKLAGSAISFYNVLFYGQGSNTYNTSKSLFNTSGGTYSNTSVNELIAKGIPAGKIVVGKPAVIDSSNRAYYIDPASLGQAFLAEYNYNKWYTGIMLWQYANDPNGTIIQTIMAPFRAAYSSLFK